MASFARETQLTTVDAWVLVDDLVDATGLAHEKVNGTIKAVAITAAADGSALGAATGLLRLTIQGRGTEYLPFALVGGTLITTGIAPGTQIMYEGLDWSAAGEVKLEAAMVGADVGTAIVTVSVFY